MAIQEAGDSKNRKQEFQTEQIVIFEENDPNQANKEYVVKGVRMAGDGQIEYLLERKYFDNAVGSNPLIEKRYCKQSELKLSPISK